MTYDEVMKEVDKNAIGESFGGNLPFNERIRLIFDGYLTAGEVKGRFMGDAFAAIDPLMRYKRDAFWIQYIQLLQAMNPNAVKAHVATRPPELLMEIYKMNLQDILDEE